jgi:hypothetical protein
VIKILFPHTTGEEKPAPSKAADQITFVSLLHFSGRFADASAILPSGPLNWGQLPCFEQEESIKVTAITVMVSDFIPGFKLIFIDLWFVNIPLRVVNILFFFDFYTSFANYGYFQPVI